jgi:hypothetical protein
MALRGGSGLSGRLLFEFDRGSKSVRLFESAQSPDMFASEVAWSPSCDRIAYQAEGSGNDLTVFDVGSGTNTRRVQQGANPVWGDTGIAFVRNGDVYLDRGSDTVQLTTSSPRDSNLVTFEQTPGETLAFRRGKNIYLIERIDQLGNDPDPSPRKVETDRDVATFDIID